MTLSAIAHGLNESGVRTKKGCRWGPQSVRRILTHSAYKGEMWYGKYRYELQRGGGRKRTAQPRSEWIEMTDNTPRIVSDELFQQVQDRLAASSARRRNGAKQPSSFVLTGFIKCERCNRSVVGSSNQRGRWRYYRCWGAMGRDDRTKCVMPGAYRPARWRSWSGMRWSDWYSSPT